MEEQPPQSEQNGIGTPAEPHEELQKKLEACEKERDEYLNGWRRAKADLINYKKEEAARAEEIIKYGSASVIHELLAIVDSFDLALRAGSSGGEQKGLATILSQLEAMLRRHGVETVKAIGEPFNPAFHEAVSEVASEKPEGVILEEAARGWKLHDKILRPSKVIISKGQL